MNKYKLDFYNEKFKQFFLSIFILTPVVIFFSKFLADFFISNFYLCFDTFNHK